MPERKEGCSRNWTQNHALQGSVEPVHKPAGEAFDNQEHLGGGLEQPHLDEDYL